MDDEKWGLVLGGGGAKGAYQIGVWKALQELNFREFRGHLSEHSIPLCG